MIPTNDLLAGYHTCSDEINAAVLRVLQSGWYVLGAEVECFEREFCDWLGVGHAIGVANGTDALMLALRAAGVQVGDAVFTVSHTAVATVAAIEMAQAVPVLIDVDEHTFTIDPQCLEDGVKNALKLGLRCKAVVPVHLYGHPCDMQAVNAVAERNGMVVVEDCSQSHGASVDGQTTGTIGLASAFSLYPTKNLGAIGDAGVVVTESFAVAESLRRLRQYGWKERNNSLIPGVNSRLDELQAAILRVRLKHLTAANERRRQIAAIYYAGLEGLDVKRPAVRGGSQHVFHQFVVRVAERDRLQAMLRAKGVSTMIHYPIPVHLQPAYRDRLPVICQLAVTERIAKEVLSLPMFPELTDEGASAVVSALSDCLSHC